MEIDFTDIEAVINHLVSDLRSLEDQQLLRPVLKISSKVKCILSTLSKAIVQLQVGYSSVLTQPRPQGAFPGKAPWGRGRLSRIDCTGALLFTCIEFDFQFLLFKKKFKLIMLVDVSEINLVSCSIISSVIYKALWTRMRSVQFAFYISSWAALLFAFSPPE